ncbi:hypothetical protein CYMTET_25689, partial [Cymbomonas tetramitiformis]
EAKATGPRSAAVEPGAEATPGVPGVNILLMQQAWQSADAKRLTVAMWFPAPMARLCPPGWAQAAGVGASLSAALHDLAPLLRPASSQRADWKADQLASRRLHDLPGAGADGGISITAEVTELRVQLPASGAAGGGDARAGGPGLCQQAETGSLLRLGLSVVAKAGDGGWNLEASATTPITLASERLPRGAGRGAPWEGGSVAREQEAASQVVARVAGWQLECSGIDPQKVGGGVAGVTVAVEVEGVSVCGRQPRPEAGPQGWSGPPGAADVRVKRGAHAAGRRRSRAEPGATRSAAGKCTAQGPCHSQVREPWEPFVATIHGGWTPILEGALLGLAMSMRNGGGGEPMGELRRWEVSVGAQAVVDYYNSDKLVWEPLLEPWSFGGSVVHSPPPPTGGGSAPSSSNPGSRITLRSFRRLDITVTAAACDAAMHALEVLALPSATGGSAEGPAAAGRWQPSQYELAREGAIAFTLPRAVAAPPSHYAVFWLENVTGTAVHFWLGGSSEAAPSDRTPADGTAAPGEMVPLLVDALAGCAGTALGRYVSLGGASDTEAAPAHARQAHGGAGRPPRPAPSRGYPAGGSEGTSGQGRRSIWFRLEGDRGMSRVLLSHPGRQSFHVGFSLGAPGGRIPEGVGLGLGAGLEAPFTALGGVHAIGGLMAAAPAQHNVVCDVRRGRHGGRWLLLRSSVAVVNETRERLELHFQRPLAMHAQVLGPLEPGKRLWLPVHLAHSGGMRWRPAAVAGSVEYRWSDELSVPQLVGQGSGPSGFTSAGGLAAGAGPAGRPRASSACGPKHPASAPVMRACVAVQPGGGEAGAAPGDSLVTLRAPLLMENLLPIPVDVWVCHDGGGEVETKLCTLEPFQCLPVHHLDPSHALRLQVQPKGLAKSELIKLATADTATLERSASWTNQEPERKGSVSGDERPADEDLLMERVLQLRPGDALLATGATRAAGVAVQVKQWVLRGCGQQRVQLRCNFWVYNFTSTTLALSDADEDLEEGAACAPPLPPSEHLLPRNAAGATSGYRPPALPSVAGLGRRTLEGSPAKMAFSERELCGLSALIVPSVADTTSATHALPGTPSSAASSNADGGARPACGEVAPKSVAEAQKPEVQLYGNATQWGKALRLRLRQGGGASVIRLHPRHVLRSALPEGRTLRFRQRGVEEQRELPSGARRALHWPCKKAARLLSVRYDEGGWDWSGGFSVETPGESLVKMRHRGRNETQVVRVEVSHPPDGSAALEVAFFCQDDGFVPFRIDNCTPETLRFRQVGCRDGEDTLAPYHSAKYAWDEPQLPHRLEVEVRGWGSLGTFRLDQVGKRAVVRLRKSGRESRSGIRSYRNVRAMVCAEGPTRVLRIEDMDAHPVDLHDTGAGSQSSSRLRVPASAVAAAQTPPPATSPPTTRAELELSVELSAVGCSLVGDVQELLYACVQGLDVRAVQTDVERKLDLWLADVQTVADNDASCALRRPCAEGGAGGPHGDAAETSWRRGVCALSQVAPLSLCLDEALLEALPAFLKDLRLTAASRKHDGPSQQPPPSQPAEQGAGGLPAAHSPVGGSPAQKQPHQRGAASPQWNGSGLDKVDWQWIGKMADKGIDKVDQWIGKGLAVETTVERQRITVDRWRIKADRLEWIKADRAVRIKADRDAERQRIMVDRSFRSSRIAGLRTGQ